MAMSYRVFAVSAFALVLTCLGSKSAYSGVDQEPESAEVRLDPDDSLERACATSGPFHVFFDKAQTDVSGRFQPLLEAVVKAAERCPFAEVVVSGFADRSGPDQLNVGISQRRADMVRA